MFEISEEEAVMTMTIQTLNAPGLVVFDARPWLKKLVFLIIVPVWIFYNTLVYFANWDAVHFTNFFWSGSATAGNLALASFVYGIFIASIVFYYRQYSLLKLQRTQAARITELEGKEKDARAKFDKLSKAAGNVVVPYPMNTLVDKGLDDFMAQTGRMRAVPPS